MSHGIIALLILGTYLGVALALWLWDGLIGFGDDFDRSDSGDLPILCFGWPICLPFILVMTIHDKISVVKKKRIAKADAKAKIRVELEQEEKKILEEVEREMELEKMRNK